MLRHPISCLFLICAMLLAAGAEAKPLVIAGTGDSQAILRILGRSFMKLHPETKVVVPESVGSGGGIKLLKKGQADLARTARPLKDKEKPGLVAHLFAYSPVVFAANPESGAVANLDKGQIEALYSGRIVNWRDLDGRSDHKIYLLQREAGDSSRKIISRVIGLLSRDSPVARTIYSTPETAATLRDIPWTLGYLPLSTAMEYGLKTITYQGIAPTAPAYPLRTPFYLVSRGEARGTAASFIAFATSARAGATMRRYGVIPLE